jgi:hypothetical protein
MNEGNFKFEFSVTEILHHKRGKQIYFLRTILFFEWTEFHFYFQPKNKRGTAHFRFAPRFVLAQKRKKKHGEGIPGRIIFGGWG